MKHYILYGHDGSGNHGCEALVRSTIACLGLTKEQTYLVSARPEEDYQNELDKLCNIVKKGEMAAPDRISFDFWKAYLGLKVKHDYSLMDDLSERATVRGRKGDIALSIGGDTYCYGGTDEIIKKNNLWRRGGLRTVYWGCSIEPELLNSTRIAADIKKYDLITARESISYKVLKEVNPNTILTVDSAFMLPREESAFSRKLEEKYIGVNLSPLVRSNEKKTGITFKNYQVLLDWILRETDYKILLIPHVIWPFNDDREALVELLSIYPGEKRLIMVPDLNCTQLKEVISRCELFVGARTHATIAAYSTFIPTLVLGYSVKSRGIAKDLFGDEEHYVLPVQRITDDDELCKAFQWVYERKEDLNSYLKKRIPEYVLPLQNAAECINNL